MSTMRYRRFGKTNVQIPVISCGGMRYQQSWSDLPAHEITQENQDNLERTVRRAVELGINHIETARGYGSSELQLGRILPSFPRQQLIIQTKVAPHETADGFLKTFDRSMSLLHLDYVDFLSIHGINDEACFHQTMRSGGCLDAARKLQEEGLCRHVGFSTHGSCELIVKTIETDGFDYVNLHWYFVNDLNWPAVQAAAQRDMGVFIISPNDKGGKLYEPPPKLVELCQPLTPMQFNSLFCLNRPEVHTLSCGASRPSDFDDHIAGLAYYDRIPETIRPIEERLIAEIDRHVGEDWRRRWFEGLPEHDAVPGDINIKEILRLWTYAKALDLIEWGKMRYNLLGNAGHWFPGQNAVALDSHDLTATLRKSPFAAQIPERLREAHALMFDEPKKRLSES